MKIVIDIPEILYTKIQNGKADKRTLETVILYGTPLRCVLDNIRAEIIDESYLSYDDNPRHIIDESCVLKILDKYTESEV